MTPTRTRFAPSPTGFLHVGGVRTALFAFLLARKEGGQFLLRIEDTDQERLVPGAIEAILEDLQWLGVAIDEGPSPEELTKIGASSPVKLGGGHGPYVQSLRLPRYQEIAEHLVKKGFAYRCDCTSERLEAERNAQMAQKLPPGYSGYCRNRGVAKETKHVIRFRLPENRTVVLDDVIRGPITWQTPALKDTVLLKSDGFPTYHLAVVVDDHDMQISHVLRGEEWIPSAPIHVLLYEALGWTAPTFAHLPSVLGQDGKKLSKRHGATGVGVFRDEGYLAEALFNFLVLIGWSPGSGDEQEIMTKEEIIEKFSLEHISSSAGIFSYDKLKWMNGMYIRKLSHEELRERIRPFLIRAGLTIDEERYRLILPHIQERLELLKDAPALVEFLFVEKLERELDAMFQKGIDRSLASTILERAAAELKHLPEFTIPAIEGAIRPLVAEIGKPAGAVFTVVRIAVTGRKVTPPLFESIHALGRACAVARIEEAVSLLRQADS
jgi:glutamyl-tRNA synthetase